MVVRLDDVEGRSIYYMGDWDPRLTWIVRRLLRPGDTMLDIGANFGLLSLVAGSLVGPTGQVHAFEPQDAVADLLRRSLDLNGLDRVSIHRMALSDKTGTMTLHIPEGHTGAASLERPQMGTSSSVEIPVRRIDDLIPELGLTRIRLMKIDVEGHESQVLGGATELFATHPPDVVVFESMERFTRPAGEPEPPFGQLPAVQFFRTLGYELFAVGRSYLRVNLSPVDLADPRHPPCADLMAVHPRALPEVAKALRLSPAPREVAKGSIPANAVSIPNG